MHTPSFPELLYNQFETILTLLLHQHNIQVYCTQFYHQIFPQLHPTNEPIIQLTNNPTDWIPMQLIFDNELTGAHDDKIIYFNIFLACHGELMTFKSLITIKSHTFINTRLFCAVHNTSKSS
eukprot:380323_1